MKQCRSLYHYALCWGLAWVTLAESLCSICTLAIWQPSWSFAYVYWMARVDMKIEATKSAAADGPVDN